MKSLHKLGLPHVFLKPGELFISREPAIVSTVLGSCVSITFYSSPARIGAICHALLPSGSIDEGYRYVDSTLMYMIARISAMGVSIPSCEVKLFGGADVLLPRSMEESRLSIGRQNIQAAERICNDLSIRFKASDTGGTQGRKLFFNSQTGDVYLKKLNKTM